MCYYRSYNLLSAATLHLTSTSLGVTPQCKNINAHFLGIVVGVFYFYLLHLRLCDVSHLLPCFYGYSIIFFIVLQSCRAVCQLLSRCLLFICLCSLYLIVIVLTVIWYLIFWLLRSLSVLGIAHHHLTYNCIHFFVLIFISEFLKQQYEFCSIFWHLTAFIYLCYFFIETIYREI